VLGKPDSYPPDPSLPICYLEVGDAVGEQVSFGGTWNVAYDVKMTVVLGAADLPREDAEERKLPFGDRFRAKFAPDPTLGGNCLDSHFIEAGNNFDIYREMDEEPPSVSYKLLVLEQTTASAAAE
jgi:hypothetical protein